MYTSYIKITDLSYFKNLKKNLIFKGMIMDD